MKRVEINASAKADIEKATLWYESQEEGLGEKFLGRVQEAIDRIAVNPEGYAKVIREARRANLEKFPYALRFKVESDAIVIACLHAKRDMVLAKERATGVIEINPPE